MLRLAQQRLRAVRLSTLACGRSVMPGVRCVTLIVFSYEMTLWRQDVILQKFVTRISGVDCLVSETDVLARLTEFMSFASCAIIQVWCITP